MCVDRTVQGLCGPSTALFRGSLNSAVPHCCGTEVVPRGFDRTTAGPRTIYYRTIEGPRLYRQDGNVAVRGIDNLAR